MPPLWLLYYLLHKPMVRPPAIMALARRGGHRSGRVGADFRRYLTASNGGDHRPTNREGPARIFHKLRRERPKSAVAARQTAIWVRNILFIREHTQIVV